MRKISNRKKGSRQKQLIIASTLVLLCILTIGYSAFQTNISINAKGNVKKKPTATIGNIDVEIVTSGDGLYADADGYIFRGANPNNYITFSGDTWRIIGIDSEGNIKIIKNESVGKKVFDPRYSTSIEGVTNANSVEGTRYSSVESDYCYASSESGYMGCKVWGSKTTTLDGSGSNTTQMKIGVTNYNLPEKEAYLNTYLNEEYLNSLTEKEKVISHIFNVGPTSSNSSDTIENTINQEKEYKWYGKIGLITPSEYIKASTDEECISISSTSSPYPCKNGNYLFNSTEYWTISPTRNTDRYKVRYVYFRGTVNYIYANGVYESSDVRPVLYLSSDTKLLGDGTSSSPYTIK